LDFFKTDGGVEELDVSLLME